MTVHLVSSEVINFWTLQVSFDYGQSWHEQQRLPCGSTICPEVTVPILRHGNYNQEVIATYRLFAHSNSSSALVNASAILNEEPDARVTLIDWDIRYGYISPDFALNGFSTITVTAGGGYNPDYLVGISLQKLGNDGYHVIYYSSCGNGMCPLELIPVTDGNYRIVLHGDNGTGAVLGFIVRK